MGAAPSASYLDALEVREVETAWGSLGLHGELGYEGLKVAVRGRHHPHAISFHPPGRAVFVLGGRYAHFACEVALNDDVLVGASHADFSVLADGRLVAAAHRVLAGGLPCPLEADVRGVDRLELVVATGRATFCHAVWLDPRLEVTGRDAISDCLERVNIAAPGNLPPATRCIATIASRGFADLLDVFLSSLRANADCEEALVAVMLVDPDTECLQVADTYGASVIECHSRRPVNSSVKSALYSLACVVPADEFVCLDVDMVVLGSLQPVFDALRACAPGSILACIDQNQDTFPNLEAALSELYGGSASDLARFLGSVQGEAGYELVLNDGSFASGRVGLLALHSAIRAMPEAPHWLDGNPLRNQFLFNLALARMRCAIRMDDAYNLQLHAQDVGVCWSGGRIEARWRGRPMRVLHFNAGGREKHADWRRYLSNTKAQARMP